MGVWTIVLGKGAPGNSDRGKREAGRQGGAACVRSLCTHGHFLLSHQPRPEADPSTSLDYTLMRNCLLK